MATITLSNSLKNTELSSLSNVVDGISFRFQIYRDLLTFSSGVDNVGSNKPTSSATITNKNGITTTTYKNPTISSSNGDYQLTGGLVLVNPTGKDVTSVATNITKIQLADSNDGFFTLSGSFYSTRTFQSNGSYLFSYSLKTSSYSYLGADGSQWIADYRVTESGSYNSSTGAQRISSTSKITNLSATDANGNNITLIGAFEYSYQLNTAKNIETNSNLTGYVTGMSLKVNGTNINATGLKISATDLRPYFLSSSGETIKVGDLMPVILSGNDVINQSSWDVITPAIYGYSGHDKITGSASNDIIHGDVFPGDRNYANIKGKDTLLGGDGNDLLDGGYGDDYLRGGNGNDFLQGAGGTDVMSGEAGNDILAANGVKDQMTGGAGADIFVFYNSDSPATAMNATITDFQTGTDFLSVAYANYGAIYGVIDSSEFLSGRGLKSSTNDAVLVYDTAAGNLYLDADGKGIGKGLLIVTLIGKPSLSAADFKAVDLSGYDLFA
jgi:Ca2+-binding RTX toxin-like protein